MPDKLVTLARFSYVAEANLAKSRLDAEGIPAFVADEHMATLNYAQAVGGIKLMVQETDMEEASHLLGLPSEGSPAPSDTSFASPHRSPLSLYIWGLVEVIVLVLIISQFVTRP
ncbi:MAG: DUF2007 domain-containing protein [SAR202 cluster bacterium]|nr:DUF2007 domain-containing protein [SAR202 cluster bacterium]